MVPHLQFEQLRTPRTIWTVRHGQRIDNIDKTWKTRAPRGAWDDPTLTARGLNQACECGTRLANEQIDAIICSPFMRCVQTAAAISTAHKDHPRICIEPGICESLNVCQDPPGYLPTDQISVDFPMVDTKYIPIISRPEPELNEIGCSGRISEVIQNSLQRFSGNLLFVSHGSPIAMFHEVLTGQWHYVGQCTISKFVSDESGHFHAVLLGDSSHLSDRTNLREREIQRPKL